MNIKDPALKGIGERMQSVRKELNLKQKNFARELDISGASLSEIEAGNIKPQFEVFYNITEKFNVNLYYLLHGKGEMFLTASAEESAALGTEQSRENRKFLETFLRYFNDSPVVRYEMMSFFTTYLVENELLIEKELEKVSREKRKKEIKNEV